MLYVVIFDFTKNNVHYTNGSVAHILTNRNI